MPVSGPPAGAYKGFQTGAWIALGGLAWLAGVAWQLQQAALWPSAVYVGLSGCAAALLALPLARLWALPLARLGTAQNHATTRTQRTLARVKPLAMAVALLALGLGATGWRAGDRLAQRLDPALEGRDLLVTGMVAAMPQDGPSGTRFIFEVERATLLDQPVPLPPRLALGWYRSFGDDQALADPRHDLRAGQRWRLPLRLKQPHGALNPHGFDAELWWFEQDLHATGYVRVAVGKAPAQWLESTAAHPVERARQSIREAIYARVSDPRLAGVLAALVVGDQAAIEREDWDLFRQTGIAHLVSISGVHVTMFAWLAGALIGAAWRRSPRLMLGLPAPLAARLGGVVVAAGYALLAGWGVPAERTVLMLACGVAMRSFGLRWPWLLVLLLTADVVTLFDPWALLQAGFWLSFAAVGLLMASEPVGGRAAPDPTDGAPPVPPPRWRNWAGEHLRAQTVATLGLAPLSLVFFQQLAVLGFVANLVAIPLVTLLITPLAFLGVLIHPLWTVAAWMVQAMIAFLSLLAAWPFAVWTAPAAPGWALVLGLLAALVAVAPLPWRVRWLAVPLALPLLMPPLDRPAPGQFELVAADVGQGTAVLVRTRHHLLVFDTGPKYGLDSDAAQRVLLPLLRARGERAVDLLVLSHRDSDHVGGAASLLAGMPVRAMASSLADDHPLRARAMPHTRCEGGQSWTWDGVRFEVLHPGADDYAGARTPNAVSCVLRVADAAGRSALITADIEAPQEAALLARYGAALASSVLLVPHHGSRTSSSAAFLDAVRPEVAVVQAGYRSRFGHPAPDVMARYAERGIKVVRSDRCGAWTWRDAEASCTRDVLRHYWHWAAPEGGGANVALPSMTGVGQR